MTSTHTTNEGANQHEHSYNHHLEFFSKAGSLFEKKESFYTKEATALDLFKQAWYADEELAFKLLLWLRDCRGGAGNRSGFRSCLRWVAANFPNWVVNNLDWIITVGRWDDLRVLFSTPVESFAAQTWISAIKERNVLAAKWADRNDRPLFLRSGHKDIGDFRRMLASIRKEHIVETKMCDNDWDKINYEFVPSVAMSRYTKAFNKHNPERFAMYKDALIKGDAKVNADVLFPHDCVRTCLGGDSAIANAQFEALPNYLKDNNERAIVIADTSGSMDVRVAGAIQAVHISQGMALYCSDRLGKSNPFYRKFIGFSEEGHFVDWSKLSFSEAVKSRTIFSKAVGHTRIDRALDLILNSAIFFKVPLDEMITSLIIVSDMQFSSEEHRGGYAATRTKMRDTLPIVKKSLTKWEEAGYKIPKIVYWNTSGYAGTPDTKYAENVALVSGFSPAILKSIFTGDDLTPMGVMKRTVQKYKVTVPE